jgi:hypothetical protein
MVIRDCRLTNDVQWFFQILITIWFYIPTVWSQTYPTTTNTTSTTETSNTTTTVACDVACTDFLSLSTPSSVIWCSCNSYLFKDNIATCSSCNAITNTAFATLLGEVSAGCVQLGFKILTIPIKQSAKSAPACTLQPSFVTLGNIASTTISTPVATSVTVTSSSAADTSHFSFKISQYIGWILMGVIFGMTLFLL